MHLDSVSELFSWASEATKNCALSDLDRHRSRLKGALMPPATIEQSRLDHLIGRMTSRTCIIIGILLNNTMNHAVTLDDSSMDEEVSSQTAHSPTCTWGTSADVTNI